MFLFYIDESGSPYSWSSTSEFFVLSAVIIEDKNWEVINEEIKSLKRNYFPSADLSTIEIKGSKIWNQQKEYATFDKAKSRKMFAELSNLIVRNEIKLISILVDKQKFLFDWFDKDMLNEAWRYLLERIEMFLTGEGENQNGLIVMDSINPGEDKKRNKLLDSFKMFGTGQVKLNHILEITFTDSGLKNLIQLADIVAYISRQHYRNDMMFAFDPYWNNIKTKFRKNPVGNYVGIGFKIIPKRK